MEDNLKGIAVIGNNPFPPGTKLEINGRVVEVLEPGRLAQLGIMPEQVENIRRRVAAAIGDAKEVNDEALWDFIDACVHNARTTERDLESCISQGVSLLTQFSASSARLEALSRRGIESIRDTLCYKPYYTGIPGGGIQCCPRDFSRQGSCGIHSAPGRYRKQRFRRK